MRGRVRWIFVVVLVLLIAGAVALVFVQKPTLDDDRDAVDARWTALRPALVTRYEHLDTALQAFVADENIKTGDIIHAVRVVTTGKPVGPGLYDCLEILGKETCLARIDRALKLASHGKSGA